MLAREEPGSLGLNRVHCVSPFSRFTAAAGHWGEYAVDSRKVVRIATKGAVSDHAPFCRSADDDVWKGEPVYI